MSLAGRVHFFIRFGGTASRNPGRRSGDALPLLPLLFRCATAESSLVISKSGSLVPGSTMRKGFAGSIASSAGPSFGGDADVTGAARGGMRPFQYPYKNVCATPVPLPTARHLGAPAHAVVRLCPVPGARF